MSKILGVMFSFGLVIVTAISFGLTINGVSVAINQLSPDFYYQSIATGLVISALIALIGGNKFGFICTISRLTNVSFGVIAGIFAVPILIVLTSTNQEIASINPAIFYYGLPLSAFLICALSGFAFVDWKSTSQTNIV